MMIATFMVAMVTTFVLTSCGSDGLENDYTSVSSSNIIGKWLITKQSVNGVTVTTGTFNAFTFKTDGTAELNDNQAMTVNWSLSGNTITLKENSHTFATLTDLTIKNSKTLEGKIKINGIDYTIDFSAYKQGE